MTDQIPKIDHALDGINRFFEIIKEIEVDIEQVSINENDKTFSFRIDLKKL